MIVEQRRTKSDVSLQTGLRQVNRHVVAVAERLAARGTFSVAVLDKIVDAIMTEYVTTGLEHVVADVRVAHRADGDVLLKKLVSQRFEMGECTIANLHASRQTHHYCPCRRSFVSGIQTPSLCPLA